VSCGSVFDSQNSNDSPAKSTVLQPLDFYLTVKTKPRLSGFVVEVVSCHRILCIYFICSFICSLVNDTDSKGNYIASNERRLMNNELGRLWKGVVRV
jgi:hypothetical protein